MRVLVTEEELVDAKMGRGLGIIDVGWIGYAVEGREGGREQGGQAVGKWMQEPGFAINCLGILGQPLPLLFLCKMRDLDLIISMTSRLMLDT